MPIHLRAEPGDYAEACLLPGDPLRAKYIAETYFDDPVQVNGERGMLGYTGEYEASPSRSSRPGWAAPRPAIVMEELVQLGVKRFLRVGTCGGLQQTSQLGDLIVALSAVPADGTARTRRRRAARADRRLGARPRGRARGEGARQQLRVGAIASSDTFYDPDAERHQRWAARGMLAVEMEAAMLFTVGALRGVQAGCLLIVSDVVDRRASSSGSPTTSCARPSTT